MFRIGDFSKMSGLSIETLYHYEKIGLLVPEYIDQTTNYRYYSPGQIITANSILVFKDAGFSLQQITDIVKHNPSTEEVIDLLDRKIEALEEDLAREVQRLNRVKTNTLLVKNGYMPQFDKVSVKKVEPILIASLKSEGTGDKEADLEHMREQLMTHINKQGSKPSKSSIVIYSNVNDAAGLATKTNIELAVPISKPFESCSTVRVYQLALVNHMACVMHSNPPHDIEKTYDIMARWLTQTGYNFAHCVREIYHGGFDDGNTRSGHFTELQFPLVGSF